MIRKSGCKLIGVLAFMLWATQSAWAYDDSVFSEGIFTSDPLMYTSDLYAANDVMIAPAEDGNGFKKLNIPDAHFEKPMMTKNDVHLLLGLASLGAAAVAALTIPENGGSGAQAVENTHHRSAWWATYLGGAAIVSGFWAHSEDVLEDEGGLFDTDNAHMALGILGTLGYYLAVTQASGNWNDTGSTGKDHATAGILGGASMVAAIAITW